MSNLSDLIPAGASGKTITATDSGSGITTKKPVIVESDGDVTQVSVSTTSENLTLGTVAEWSSTEVSNMDVAFDSGANKVVIVYRDNGSSNYLGAQVGTVTVGTGAVSWGGKTVLNSEASYYPKIAADPNATGKFIVTWSAGHTQSKVAVLSLSGTTPSIAGTTNAGGATTNYYEIAADPNTTGLFVVAGVEGADRYVDAVALTYSGSTFTIGGVTTMNSTTAEERTGFSVAFDQNTAGKFGCAYQQYASPYHGYFVGGTISGTTITAGTEEVFRSGTTNHVNIAFDPATADKLMVTYYTGSTTTMGATVATLSGTDATWGTEVTDAAAATPQANQGTKLMPVYGGSGDNYYLGAALNDGSGTSYLVRITTSGTVPTWATWTRIGDKQHGGDQGGYGISRHNKGLICSAWLENTSDDGDFRISQGEATTTNLTATNFVGIADEAITASASGNIVVQGGTITGLSSLTIGSQYYVRTDATFNTTAGTPSVKAGVALSTTSLLLNGDT